MKHGLAVGLVAANRGKREGNLRKGVVQVVYIVTRMDNWTRLVMPSATWGTETVTPWSFEKDEHGPQREAPVVG